MASTPLVLCYNFGASLTLSNFFVSIGVLYHRWNKFCKAKYHYIEADRLDSSSKAKKQLNVLKKSGKIERCFIEGVK